MQRTRAGAVLLEVIVALTILAISAMTMVTLAAESAQTVGHVRQAEVMVRQASAYLSIVSLWPRADLDRHLGNRWQGPWRMRIDRPLPTLYTVTLTDTITGMELLRTALYRPEVASATP